MRIALSKLICILLLSTTVCAQDIYIVVGGDKPPAFVGDKNVIEYFDKMYVDVSIPDTLDHVILITGDHEFFGDTIKIFRQLTIYETNGDTLDYYIQTNKEMKHWHFNPHHHEKVYLSEYTIEQ